MTNAQLRIFDSIELDENQVGVILSALNNYGYEASRMSEDMNLSKMSREENARLSKLAFTTAKILHAQIDLGKSDIT